MKADPEQLGTEEEGWSTLIQKFAKERDELLEVRGGATALWEKFRWHVPFATAQVVQYAAVLANEQAERRDLVSLRKMIASTRGALRFGLTSLSSLAGMDDDTTGRARLSAQHDLAEHTAPLLTILSSAKGDRKCRVLSAQVLCNLVTKNARNSSSLMGSTTLSPSTAAPGDMAKVGDGELASNTPSINWVNMMLRASHAGQREALAAIVAALHNAIVCLDTQNTVVSASNNLDLSLQTTTQGTGLAYTLAICPLLMLTLTRQIVSADVVLKALLENQRTSASTIDATDIATEWILLLLEHLCRHGWLPVMYKALNTSSSGQTQNFMFEKINPEQLVLLYSIRNLIANEKTSTATDSSKTNSPDVFLGGDGEDEHIVDTHLFLVELYCRLRGALLSLAGGAADDETILRSLAGASFVPLMDILGESLALDCPIMTRIRKLIADLDVGVEFLPSLAVDLGQMLDTISVRNKGRHVRQIHLQHDEQQSLTIRVRMMANLCFQCRRQQDLLRTTLVPISKVGVTATTTSVEQSQATERTALHILLSCTSLSHACFTLREWAVVAIRNALQDNEANQKVVAELEAQQAVQTSEVEHMGIRVELDNTTGRVSVVPIEQHDDDQTYSPNISDSNIGDADEEQEPGD